MQRVMNINNKLRQIGLADRVVADISTNDIGAKLNYFAAILCLLVCWLFHVSIPFVRIFNTNKRPALIRCGTKTNIGNNQGVNRTK